MAKLPYHIHGKLHLTGSSRFIADEAPLAHMLHAAFLFSPVAHASIVKMDLAAAKAVPGVTAVLSAADVPGVNQIGHVIKDEPLFPTDEIMYIGQPLAMVLSEDPRLAEEAVKLIHLEYNELPPILDVDVADALSEWYIPERKIERGNIEEAIMDSIFVLAGETESAAQEHFYMEGQRCRAIPGEGDTLHLLTATQSTMEVQEVLSHVLNIAAHHIIVEVPRLGGAFGGKERAATIWSCMAGLGAKLTGRPVEVKLSRDEDMLSTGKRHPFKSRWRIGFDHDGIITAWDVELLANGGAYADLSIAILERALFHADNTYHIPHCRIRGRACRTNLPPNTAFRGFGAPQGIFVIENAIQRIAEHLRLDPLEVRLRNAYNSGDIAPYGQPVCESSAAAMMQQVAVNADYAKLRSDVDAFNANQGRMRQGIGIAPVKFGISFTTALLNQGSALIWVYIDGSVSVSTGGVEMGQELNTKVAMVVSRVLGIPFTDIRVESSHSQRVGNASPTAASTGSDINGNAARIASEKIREQLSAPARALISSKYGIDASEAELSFADAHVFPSANPDAKVSFQELVRHAYNERVPLAAYGYYRTPNLHYDRERGVGHPFHYYVFGCAISHTQIDTYTGDHQVLGTWIVHENGNSLHLDVDRGQIIGAFIQSYGWCTMEELPLHASGRYLAVNPSTYKIPTVRDMPAKLDVQIVTSQNEHASVFGSKATGEPPFIYGLSVWFAIRDAINSVNPANSLSFPATPEAILAQIPD